MPVLYFTVTNDLSYDQRMIRICNSLVRAGYTVVLVGRLRKKSIPLTKQLFHQKRLSCFFEKGFLFYAAYNLRLFFYLLFKKAEGICAIDLDTILPVFLVSKIKGTKRIYDAHELFCEMKEIVSRPTLYRFWKGLEKITVPYFKHGYTVNEPISKEFFRMYGNNYDVIRSIGVYEPSTEQIPKEKFILYQGAVNEGRCFEQLIPAMRLVPATLVVCGDGNFMTQTKQLVAGHQLQNKVIFTGMLPPHALKEYTARAYIGITLFEKESKSNYFSLANRFFDYIHAGTPQLCMNYPVYREINNLYGIAVLIHEPNSDSIAAALNELLNNEAKWESLHQHCLHTATILNWQEEEKKLLTFYKKLFG